MTHLLFSFHKALFPLEIFAIAIMASKGQYILQMLHYNQNFLSLSFHFFTKCIIIQE